MIRMTRLPSGVRVATVPVFYRPMSELDLRYLDGRHWELLAPFTYASVLLQRVLEVPRGFVTDFASIPRLLWPVLPPTGTYGKAALVHDDLYRTPGLATRAQADAVLLEAMTELGVGWWTRQVIYRGVRVGGGSAYHGGLAA